MNGGRLVALSLLGLLGLLGACNEPKPATPEDGASPPALVEGVSTVEILTWWNRGGRHDPVRVLTDVHAKHAPDDVVLNASADLSGLTRITLERRIDAGEPPETFQANVGHDLMRWVLRNGTDARESKLLPLDEVMPRAVEEWREVFPREIVERLSYDGKMYAVPVNVHRVNSIFYNVAVFEAHGLPEPRTLQDLHEAAARLEGTGIHLLAVGSREPWTLALLAFECVLVAEHGAEFYERYFEGRLTADDPRIRQSLRTTLGLLAHANPDHRRLSWLQALDRMMQGEAAILVMGDWARAFIEAEGGVMGEEFRELPFPGSSETFVYTSDTFSLPARARNQPGAQRLLKTLGSVEGQQALAAVRVTLAARTDVEAPDAPSMRAKHELFLRGPLVLALSGIAPARFVQDVALSLAEMALERDIDPVVLTLRSRYALLR